MKSPHGWKRAFDDPILLPDGRQIDTLHQAGSYITNLPKAEQQLAEWQTAIGCLLMAAEDRGPLMHARIGMMRALNRHVVRVFNSESQRYPLGEKEASARSVRLWTEPK